MLINSEIYLEKSVVYNMRSSVFFKFILLVEYLIIFAESLKSFMIISKIDLETQVDGGLLIIKYLNPYSYFVKTSTCSQSSNDSTICIVSSNYLFYGIFVVNNLVYLLYKIRYEKAYRTSPNFLKTEREGDFKYIDNHSYIQFIIINYLNIFSKPLSIFIYFINFNTLISSLLSITANGAFSATNLLLVLISLFGTAFSIVLDFNKVQSSNLMINHMQIQSHFDSFFSIKYDHFLISMKILISINSNIQLMKLITGQLETFLNLVIISLIVLFAISHFISIQSGEVIVLTNLDSNFFRLQLVNYNCLFLIIFIPFLHSFRKISLMATSVILTLLLTLFLTKISRNKNIKNMMTKPNLVYMLVHIFEMIDEDSRKIFELEFLCKHKITCEHSQNTPIGLNNDDNQTMLSQMCFICNCLSVEEGIQKQIIHNCKYFKTSLNKTETQYYKLVKLYMANANVKPVKMLFNTHKLLKNSANKYHSEIRIYFDIISLNINCLESHKQYKVLKLSQEVNTLISETIENLHFSYQTLNSRKNEIYKTAEKLAKLKHKINDKLSELNSDKKNDNNHLLIHKYIYKNLFNDEESFITEETSFNHYHEQLTQLEDKNIFIISYIPSTSTFLIVNAPYLFREYHMKHFEILFPAEVRVFQKEKLMQLIQESSSINFDFSCYVTNSKDNYISKVNFSGSISYCIDMTEMFIKAEYKIEKDAIIMGICEPTGLTIRNLSHDLGEFLHLSQTNLLFYRQSGQTVYFNNIFNQCEEVEGDYIFDFFKLHSFYLKLWEELNSNMDKDDDTLKMLEKFFNTVNVNKMVHPTFKISKLEKISQIVFFSAEPTFKKDLKIASLHQKTETFQDVATKLILPESSSSLSSSLNNNIKNAYFGGDISLYERKTKAEKLNNDKLVRLCNALKVFSTLSVIYCGVLMGIGIIGSTNINQSFQIKSNYDKLARNFYQITTNIFNVILVLDKDALVFSQRDMDLLLYFDRLQNKSKISLNIVQFLNDLTVVEADIFLNTVFDFQKLISSSSYEEEIKAVFSPMYNYSTFSNVAGKYGSITNSYTIFDIVEIYMNNLIYIRVQPNFFQLIYIITFNTQVADFSNIYNPDLNPSMMKIYEILINYVNIYKYLENINSQIDEFQDNVLKDVFSEIFNLSYFLIAFHFILLIICIMLVAHFKKTMKHNIQTISNLINSEINISSMEKKLENLKYLNKSYTKDPIHQIKKLGKAKKQHLDAVKEQIKKEEKEEGGNISNYTISNENPKEITPITNLMATLLSIYFVYSLIFILFLNQRTHQVIVATDLYKINSEKFKTLINTQNLLNVEILVNTTDARLYEDIKGSNPNNKNFVYDLGVQMYSTWKSFFYYKENDNLFEPLKNFYRNNLTCDFLYYDTNDTVYNTLILKYQRDNKSVDLLKSLSAICRTLDLIPPSNKNLIEENIIYLTNQLLNSYSTTNGIYAQMKKLFNLDAFFDLLMIVIVILRPMQTYLNDILILNIEVSCIQTFLSLSLVYLSINVVVDFIILLIFNKVIVKRIKKIDDNLIRMKDILKVY